MVHERALIHYLIAGTYSNVVSTNNLLLPKILQYLLCSTFMWAQLIPLYWYMKNQCE